MDADIALAVRGARVRFGAVVPCDGVDVTVHAGEIVAIIGPNGAGKSTLLDAISGFAPLEAGSVAIGGTDVTRALPYRRARLGLARSFQDARGFANMTVREALLGSLHGRFRGGLAHVNIVTNLVFSGMSGSGSGAPAEFARSAAAILERRVQNSPPARNEDRGRQRAGRQSR